MNSRVGFLKTVGLSLITILLFSIAALTLSCGGSGTTNGSDDNDDNNSNNTAIEDLASGVTVTGLPAGDNLIPGCTVFQPFLIDMDGDSKLDILVGTVDTSTTPDTHKTLFFRNTSNGTLSFEYDTTTLTPLPSIQDANNVNILYSAAGDIDTDTDLDIMATNCLSTPSVDINRYTNNGSNSFTPTTDKTSPYNASLTLVDILDDDDDPDMVIGKTVDYYGDGTVFKGDIIPRVNVSGTFSDDPAFIRMDIVSMSDVPVLAFVDMDNDLDLDMYITLFESKTISYYENIGIVGTPAFSSTPSTDPLSFDPPVGEAWFLSFGDVDGDTDIDAIIGTDDGYIYFSENTMIDN